MSKFTPDTFFVEALYIAKAIDENTSTREARFEFYRWLDWMATQHFQIEQERIIKLLDAEIERIWKLKDYPATNALANIRAGIKGEQK